MSRSTCAKISPGKASSAWPGAGGQIQIYRSILRAGPGRRPVIRDRCRRSSRSAHVGSAPRATLSHRGSETTPPCANFCPEHAKAHPRLAHIFWATTAGQSNSQKNARRFDPKISKIGRRQCKEIRFNGQQVSARPENRGRHTGRPQSARRGTPTEGGLERCSRRRLGRYGPCSFPP